MLGVTQLIGFGGRAQTLADTGWLSPGTLASSTLSIDNTGGVYAGPEAWTNASNAASSNDVDADFAGGLDSFTVSEYLVATNFSISLPAGATIDGVEVSLELAGNSDITLSGVCLVNSSARIGTEKAPAQALTTGDVIYSYGSSTDKFSAALTKAIVEGSTFGAAGWVTNTDVMSAVVVTCDHMRLKVHYRY